ncbi:MAG: hypothetical protein KGM17_11960 [Sphingomonadales bacterium]|nr:hypothetical protein [Sphingomonadales bacterium]
MHADSPLLPAAGLLHTRAETCAPAFWQGGAAGLRPAHLHEFHAREAGDAAAAAGLVAAVAIGVSGPTVWLRARRGGSAEATAGAVIHGAGWAELGGAPGHCLFVLAEDAKALLRSGLDAVRSGGARVVVIEARGRMPELDLTASRRLALAAGDANVLLLVLRSEADRAPSAAWTRWAVASAPSRPLEANAPGLPAFDIELLRHRAGPAGARWRLEWDRDRREFRDPGEPALPGAVVSAPFGGALAAGSGGQRRRVA